jgi:hypothetical protein
MQQFITKHRRDAIGTLSGFDRVRFRGTIRMLAYARGLLGWLCERGVLLKEFGTFAEELTAMLKESVEAVARAGGRSVRYLASSALSKEDLVQELIRREGLSGSEGLVCVLSCVEPCRTFQIQRNRETRHIDLVSSPRKCLHWYLYFLDPVLGLCHVRVQSWLPFTVHVCIKHRLNHNSIKMYDKQGSVLRIETTINDAHDLSVYRASESDPGGPKKWQPLRKGVVDLPRRAEISQAANSRYLTALADADSATPLGKLADAVRSPVLRDGRRFRGLNPLSGPDAELAEILLRGEFLLNGFRNRDVRALLHPNTTCAAEQRRQSARVGRLLKLFREHGLIRKIPGTHRYQSTAAGRRLLPAFIAARNASAQALQQTAA